MNISLVSSSVGRNRPFSKVLSGRVYDFVKQAVSCFSLFG